MNVRTFRDEVPLWMAASLDDFEREFTYPLGPGGARFRISHGRDYLRFFRAMGSAACVVAEKDGKVLGTISGAIVALEIAGASLPALYIGDLKVAASARGTRVFFLLARTLESWARERAAAAFAVVMDGTSITPDDYSGRAGLPGFSIVAKLSLLRVDGALAKARAPRAEKIADKDALPIVRSLAGSRVLHAGGQPGLRARFEPEWRRLGNAVGLLEDTLASKRLLALDESEIASSHLTRFAWREPRDAAALLAALATEPGDRPRALFTAVDSTDAPAIVAALGAIDPALSVTLSPATVYAHGVPPDVGWLVNTSEI